jgi:hypothetical protein
LWTGVGAGGIHPFESGYRFALALLEAESVAVYLQDGDLMGKFLQQCAGETLQSKDFGPFLEGQIAGSSVELDRYAEVWEKLRNHYDSLKREDANVVERSL